ncbi:TetR/AcrR family transcriptional regulator [Bradyrhizobium elkanii]|uniref:TetR/AcrR family transcriptional regulator n=1 Tax=Bradyrhizobium elkanii TaxID=29448 RepID=UPI0020A1CD42|nr:TetR/AcrR family transcriptional regulator [Bradyrhizobium elkanii]MCP1968486.1 TetR/AcrR family transcriptional repressor of nem operon [Bradyrhizobium elkanii]MCS4110013.1 TetR/AcrR family transcriptional repressor of nem operon [Bradyrhizobium elkanii]
MGHSQADKAKSRQRILDSAAIQIRELGLHGLSITELMKSAKLTHGGFYGHFDSREQLISEALAKALSEGGPETVRLGNAKGPRNLKALLNTYLSKAHRDDPSVGCAVAALAGDVARSDRGTRDVMTSYLSQYFDNVADLLEGEHPDESAIAVVCTMVGALALSRVSRDASMSDKILRAAQRSILDLVECRESTER